MTPAILVFAGLGAALTALIALLAPHRPGLLVAVGRLDAARTAPPAAARDDAGTLSRQARLGLLT
nr:hypothetical protein [Sporichthya sp.]